MDETLREPPYPLQAHLGFAMDEWTADLCRLIQPMAPHLGNRHGIPHGGVHATLLDTAMGFAVCYTGDPEAKQMTVTLSLNVSYLGVARGEQLIAEGRKTGGGKSTAFAEGEIKDENGNLIATATGVFRYVGTRKGETK